MTDFCTGDVRRATAAGTDGVGFVKFDYLPVVDIGSVDHHLPNSTLWQ